MPHRCWRGGNVADRQGYRRRRTTDLSAACGMPSVANQCGGLRQGQRVEPRGSDSRCLLTAAGKSPHSTGYRQLKAGVWTSNVIRTSHASAEGGMAE